MLTWTLRKLKSADAATRLRAAVNLGEAGGTFWQ